MSRTILNPGGLTGESYVRKRRTYFTHSLCVLSASRMKRLVIKRDVMLNTLYCKLWPVCYYSCKNRSISNFISVSLPYCNSNSAERIFVKFGFPIFIQIYLHNFAATTNDTLPDELKRHYSHLKRNSLNINPIEYYL
jgi:hypothetical protein